MKKSFAWFLAFAPAAVMYACGGSDSNSLDGGPDSTTSDAPNNSDVVNNNDSGGMDSSQNNDSSMGMDGGMDGTMVSISCTEPAQCVDGGNLDAAYPPGDAGVVCCATVNTSGTFPGCSIDSVSTQCAAPGTCPSTLDTMGCGTDKLRACGHNSECTEPGYNKCCYVQLDAGKAQACMNTLMIGLLHPTCLDGG